MICIWLIIPFCYNYPAMPCTVGQKGAFFFFLIVYLGSIRIEKKFNWSKKMFLMNTKQISQYCFFRFRMVLGIWTSVHCSDLIISLIIVKNTWDLNLYMTLIPNFCQTILFIYLSYVIIIWYIICIISKV